MEGYKIMFDQTIVTVWSAPNYCYRYVVSEIPSVISRVMKFLLLNHLIIFLNTCLTCGTPSGFNNICAGYILFSGEEYWVWLEVIFSQLRERSFNSRARWASRSRVQGIQSCTHCKSLLISKSIWKNCIRFGLSVLISFVVAGCQVNSSKTSTRGLLLVIIMSRNEWTIQAHVFHISYIFCPRFQ